MTLQAGHHCGSYVVTEISPLAAYYGRSADLLAMPKSRTDCNQARAGARMMRVSWGKQDSIQSLITISNNL